VQCPSGVITCYDCPQTSCPNLAKVQEQCCLCHSPMHTYVYNTWEELRPLCEKCYKDYNRGVASIKGRLDTLPKPKKSLVEQHRKRRVKQRERRTRRNTRREI
jgi:hypothetical protein